MHWTLNSVLSYINYNLCVYGIHSFPIHNVMWHLHVDCGRVWINMHWCLNFCSRFLWGKPSWTRPSPRHYASTRILSIYYLLTSVTTYKLTDCEYKISSRLKIWQVSTKRFNSPLMSSRLHAFIFIFWRVELHSYEVCLFMIC